MLSQIWDKTGRPLTDDALKPIANSLLVQPYNALANVVNAVTKPVLGIEMPKANPFDLPPAEFLSPEWFVQNISSGLSSAAVYYGAGKLAGAGLGKLAGEGELAAALASPRTGRIVGGMLFEGARDTNPGETHFGNLLGGAAAFSLFEGGNALSSQWGANKYLARALTGATGMTAGRIISQGVGTGTVPSWEDLGKTAVTGGAMNLLLPELQERIVSAPARTAQTVKLTPQPLFASSDLMLRLDSAIESPATARDTMMTRSSTESLQGVSESRIERVPYITGMDGGPFNSRSDYLLSRVGRYKPEMQIMRLTHSPTTELAVPLVSDVPIDTAAALEAVKALPDARLVRRLSLLDRPHPEQQWLRQQTGNPELKVEAEAFPNGDINVYRPGLEGDLPMTVGHEWNHLFKLAEPAASQAFDQVGDIEPVSTDVHSAFPELESHEAWSYIGEHLLRMPTNPGEAVLTASTNPIRASIWGRALASRMASMPEEQLPASADAYRNLTTFIEQSVRPQAISALQDVVATGETSSAQRARSIIDYLTGKP